MKTGFKTAFYFKLALNNIRKNYRFFVPRILTGAGLLGCFYIVFTLAMDERLAQVRGGTYIPTIMGLGTYVMALLSFILMLYTNSFLMKQRKREFGMYNVLGMEKRHVGRVILHEMMIGGFISVALGLVFGILFYKLSSLLICRLLGVDVILGFYFIRLKTLIPPAIFFILLDTLTYLFNRISIARLKPVELINSSHTGEREPKVKWLILVVGIITLSAGYYIALTTKSPLEALYLFFFAVILVIAGTYCLFVSGSIFILKLLKKNERFYYNKNHMTAVSGLLYRMKQNAVGLASIAILATGVLVMISTTVSLYSGMQQTLDQNYPYHLYISAGYEDKEGNVVQIPRELLAQIVEEAAREYGVGIRSVEMQRYLQVAYMYEKGAFTSTVPRVFDLNFGNVANVTFITRDEYENLTGAKLELDKGEIAVCAISTKFGDRGITNGFLTIDGKTYRVAMTLKSFPVQDRMSTTVNCYGIIVSDNETLDEIYESQKEAYDVRASEYINQLAVLYADTQKACDAGQAMHDTIWRKLFAAYRDQEENIGSWRIDFDSLWDAREYIYGMYGTLLFLGILLGFVCMFATVLIIYYKQISEGYEDRNRYQIMQKIGMGPDEVRKSIQRQILMVFFLPLVVAGVHTAFAFPILEKLLHILLLSSTWLFVGCSIIVYVVFAVVYVLIYAGTAKVYYQIVR